MNEKTAIKRFAYGLSDMRLSTIIASRQFSSLSEAIRASVDEQVLSSEHDQVAHYSQERRPYRPNYFPNNRDRYSSVRGHYFNRGRGNTFSQYHSATNRNISQSAVNNTGHRGERTTQYFARSARGSQPARAPRAPPSPRIHQVQHDDIDVGHRSDDYPNQFFVPKLNYGIFSYNNTSIVNCKIGNHLIDLLVDSGASLCVLKYE